MKVQNNPARLFSLMHNIISSHDGWETRLAPRILLGLWHPTFLPHAVEHLPYCRRSYIGEDTVLARKYFWDNVDAFSMWFGSLTTTDGERSVRSRQTAAYHAHIVRQIQEGVQGGGQEAHGLDCQRSIADDGGEILDHAWRATVSLTV